MSNYNNYEISLEQTNLLWTAENVMGIVAQRLKFISNLDKDIYNNSRAYTKKWKKLNEIVRIVFDNG